MFITAVALIAILVYLVLTTIAIIVLGVKISQLQSSVNANLDQQIIDSAQDVQLDSLLQRIEALENSTGQDLFNKGISPLLPAPSCAALPSCAPSGYYWVRASNGSAVRVYCDMTRTCGNVTGGWMRVAELDMTNSSHQCLSGLRQHSDFDLCTCGVDADFGFCSSVLLSTNTIQYSQVCGRIIAYQFRSTDAFGFRPQVIQEDIDRDYVDGVSLTHGPPVRQHIWTFAAAFGESLNASSNCPCIYPNGEDAGPPPSFVGDDYFCDTGNEDADPMDLSEYTDDPLWDGAGCGPENTCCSLNSPPWFYKQLPQPTTDDIEMRVCCDQDRFDEDIRIEMIDIYVQ